MERLGAPTLPIGLSSRAGATANRGTNPTPADVVSNTTMDKDRIKGKGKEIEGRLQQAKGDLTGNDADRAEGAAKKAEGKIQNAVGKAKDGIRKALD